MTRTRLSTAACITLLVLAFARPADGATLEEDLQRRESTQAKKARLAGQLDTLKAENGQIEAAVQTLDASVATQASTTAAASQAVEVATEQVSAAEARLAATESHMGHLKGQVSAVAVRAYVHPSGDTLLDIVRAHDLAEASRREAMLSHIVNNDRAAIGQLRATKEDQQIQQAEVARLRDEAESRRQAAAERLASLQESLAQQTRLKADLQSRINTYQVETDALNREQANIEGVIRARQAPVSSGGGGGSAGSSSGGGGGSPAVADDGPRPASASGLIWPVGGSVTSGFGPRWGRMHSGIDISAGTGTPIRAAKSGTVISAGSYGGYGLATIVDHGGGFTTLYAHQSEMAAGDGQSVGQGDLIGYVGCTGSCTGAHLHFETRVGGSAQNPMNFLP